MPDAAKSDERKEDIEKNEKHKCESEIQNTPCATKIAIFYNIYRRSFVLFTVEFLHSQALGTLVVQGDPLHGDCGDLWF
jgi:hypothetical protein